MRIACLQFASRVGDVDNNLSRADAVLNRVALEELDNLDLLVLPELSFTGYNFRSLQHIHPCLEEAGSGISSLWARTTALKHDCTVVVGYPEKVDVSAKWPASPEYHNSALVVNGDGDTVGNYRKSFLYYTDETWALEGPDGFLRRKLPGLGNVALGIGTDLNPYKLESPWDAFEFGLHVLKAQANLVIMTMAWQTHQDAATFARNPQEPDLETLVYWVQRLEPVIRADNEEEVIVVFCNRTGAEEEVTYTGTSAVIGVRKGEVFVYGVLGRGVDDILVVDTDRPPRCKLTDADSAVVDDRSVSKTGLEPETNGHHTHSISDHTPDESEVCQCHLVDAALGAPPLDSPRTATSPKLPWLAQYDHPGGTPTDSRSPTRLQIPTRPPKLDEYTIPTIDSAITDDIIDTPGFSAFPYTPAGLPSNSSRPSRPKLAIPSSSSFSPSPWRFPNSNKQSPYPWHAPSRDGLWSSQSQSAVFGGGGALTPITPFDEDGWSSTPIDAKAPGWFWRHEPRLEALRESVKEEEEEEEEEERGNKVERVVGGRKGEGTEKAAGDVGRIVGREGVKEMQERGKRGQGVALLEPSVGGRGGRGETARDKGQQRQQQHPRQHEGQQQQHQNQQHPPQEQTYKPVPHEAPPPPEPKADPAREEEEPEQEDSSDGPLLTNDWADLAHVLNTFRSRDRDRTRPSSTALDDLRSSSRADSRPSSPKSRNLSGRSGAYGDGDGDGDGAEDGGGQSGYAHEPAEDAWRRAASKSTGRKQQLLLGRSHSFDASGAGGGGGGGGTTRPRLPRRQSRLRHETYLGDGGEGEDDGDEYDEDVGWNPRMNGTESVLVGSAGAAGFGV